MAVLQHISKELCTPTASSSVNCAKTLSLLRLIVFLLHKPIAEATDAPKKNNKANKAFQLLRGKLKGSHNCLVSTIISKKRKRDAVLKVAKIIFAILHCTRYDSPDASNYGKKSIRGERKCWKGRKTMLCGYYIIFDVCLTLPTRFRPYTPTCMRIKSRRWIIVHNRFWT